MSKNELLSHKGLLFAVSVHSKNIIKIDVVSVIDYGTCVYVNAKTCGYNELFHRFFKNYWDARYWAGKYMT